MTLYLLAIIAELEARTSKKLLFPAPFSPIKPKTLPLGICKSMFFKEKSLYDFVRFLIVTAFFIYLPPNKIFSKF